MMPNLSLEPLLRQAIGFDKLHGLFETMLRGEGPIPAYPPYNIEKTEENCYCITMAVAGFRDRDLHITVQNDQLIISGRIEEHKDEMQKRGKGEFLYHGIASRAFERTFSLASHMKVLD